MMSSKNGHFFISSEVSLSSVVSRAMFTDSAEYIPIFRSTVLPRLAIIFMGAHAELSNSLQIIVTKVSINVFFGLNGRLDYGVP